MEINKVLVADAVDEACLNLLRENNIKVEKKLKLPKEQLIQEIVVSKFIYCLLNLIWNVIISN